MRSFLNYIGGKSRLARVVADKLPASRCYCEVFGGAGWVLFAREPSYVEVLNDGNGRLVNLYRVVRDAPDELAEALELLPRSRKLYRELRKAFRAGDPVAAAAVYYYLVKNAFSGQVGCGFSSSKEYPGKYSMLADFKLWARRLNKVTIENLAYEDCLRRYDAADTVFYLDPPYVGTERYYGGDFTTADHERLHGIVKRLKGRWLVSYKDCGAVRALYDGFNVEEVRPRYCADKVRPRGTRRADGRELFITNY
jgi:DNA adenine methylase